MQFSVRSLFGLVYACALLSVYVVLPSDFQEFLLVMALLVPGAGCLFYVAFAQQIRMPYFVSFVIACAAVAIVMLLRWA